MDEVIEEGIHFVDSDHSLFIYRSDVSPLFRRYIFQNSAFLHSLVEYAGYFLLEFCRPGKHFLYAFQLHLDVLRMILGMFWDAGVAERLKVPYIPNADKAYAFFLVLGAFPAL